MKTDERRPGLPRLLLLGIAGLVTLMVTWHAPAVMGAGAAMPTPTPTALWPALQGQTPYAYASPLPAPALTLLDGTYAKLEDSPPQWWACRRCADYRPVGGIWRLQFDRGVMRMLYEVTGWHSLASYALDDDRLVLFNDPYCPEVTGEYRWEVADDQLTLTPIADSCAFGLRARNLSQQPWPLCDPQAARQPVGCVDPVPPAPVATTLPVTVIGGDSRSFATPPAPYVTASVAPARMPEDIEFRFSPGSFPYGLYRILWWDGPWAEVTAEYSTPADANAIGVQFMGDQQVGWARVLFDGEEVWRGDTSAIWSRAGRYGGYVEVAGFAPGTHTLRVEALGFDHRPVAIAGFGFGPAHVDAPAAHE